MLQTSEVQEFRDMGLSASMRRSRCRTGRGHSSELEVGLSQLISFTFNPNPKASVKLLLHLLYFCVNVVICVLKTYIRFLQAGSGAALCLKREDGVLQLHQLTPQCVLLSQDAGDHGLGIVSGLEGLHAN